MGSKAPNWKMLREVAASSSDDISISVQAVSLALEGRSDDFWTEISNDIKNWEKCAFVIKALTKLDQLFSTFPALMKPGLEAAWSSLELMEAIDGQLQAVINASVGKYTAVVVETVRDIASMMARYSKLKEERCFFFLKAGLQEICQDCFEEKSCLSNQWKDKLSYMEDAINHEQKLESSPDKTCKSEQNYLLHLESMHTEDFVDGLRIDVDVLKRARTFPEFDSLCFYGEVTVTGFHPSTDGLSARLAMDRRDFDYETMELASSKRLLEGSLLVLLNYADGEHCLATVATGDNQRQDLGRGIVTVSLRNSSWDLDFALSRRHLLMFESRAYLEAFWPVAKSLHETKKLPLKDYFLDASNLSQEKLATSAVSIPVDAISRLFKTQRDKKTSKEVYYGLMSNEKEVYSGKECDVLSLLKNREIVEEAQLEAVRSSIEREMSVIQGPPGTGKSHVGTIVLAIMLAMKEKTSPILVISQTNRCLDSLLESLLPVTDRIVRLGSRCTSDKLENHCLGALRQFAKDQMVRESTLHKGEKALRAEKGKIEVGMERDLTSLPDFPSKSQVEKILKSCESLSNYQKSVDDLRTIESALLLKGRVHVIGATSTGAAKNRRLLDLLCPRAALVEEAALMTEPQLVAALPASVERLVLIGDHQQLRPSTVSHLTAKKSGLDVSFFERLILSGQPHSQLGTQHRMRPKVSRLVSSLFYPGLKDHSSVTKFKNIPGMKKNVFFLRHDNAESASAFSKSRSNDFEAGFLTQLALHLVEGQGIAAKEVTVLTAYVGQQLLIQKEMSSHPELSNLAVLTVDNFQGDENRIILLSLVRGGSADGGIGFLGEANRLCVALSRAREGLYIVGNMGALKARSKMWAKLDELLGDDAGEVLEVSCFAHSEQIRVVKSVEDFKRSNGQGCPLKCGVELSCGHKCVRPCHLVDRTSHSSERFRCLEPCQKTCDLGHPCPKTCSEPCGECDVVIPEIVGNCGHAVRDVRCGLRQCADCGRVCNATMNCGHQCGLPCHGDSGDHNAECKERCRRPKRGCDSSAHFCGKRCHEPCEPCLEPVSKKLPCGHQADDVPCSRAPGDVECRKRCKKALKCGHVCKNYCYECADGGCDPCYRCP